MTLEQNLEDIRNNPQNHKHRHDELVACCMIDGAVDIRLMEAHSECVDLGENGGVKCDVVEGPCACGAWH